MYALAHPRGGGALGRYWWADGKLLAKNHTFDDVAAAADALVAAKYAAPGRIALWGRSAGGLTAGAVVNRRPGLLQVRRASWRCGGEEGTGTVCRPPAACCHAALRVVGTPHITSAPHVHPLNCPLAAEQAAILDVPFVDVLSSMSDPSLPLTATEYDEWGNPSADPVRGFKLRA